MSGMVFNNGKSPLPSPKSIVPFRCELYIAFSLLHGKNGSLCYMEKMGYCLSNSLCYFMAHEHPHRAGRKRPNGIGKDTCLWPRGNEHT